MLKPFTVLHFGSHPDLDNDDCFAGEDFEGLAEAIVSATYKSAPFDVEYIMLDGPGMNEVRKNPNYSAKEKRFNDAIDSSEHAMQQGMCFGCQGYNDAMGYY